MFLRYSPVAAVAGATSAAALLSVAVRDANAAPVTGSGTVGRIPKWTGSSSIGDSIQSDTGTSISPIADNASDLGSTGNRWKTTFVGLPISTVEVWTPLQGVDLWATAISSGAVSAVGGPRTQELSANAAAHLDKYVQGVGSMAQFDFSKDLFMKFRANVFRDPPPAPGLNYTAGSVGLWDLTISQRVRLEMEARESGFIRWIVRADNGSTFSILELLSSAANDENHTVAIFKRGATVHAWLDGVYKGSTGNAPTSGFVYFHASVLAPSAASVKTRFQSVEVGVAS